MADDADARRAELADLSVRELVEKILALEHDRSRLVERLLSAVPSFGPVCGVVGCGVSCQLPRDHDGLHAWMRPDASELYRW